MDYGIHIAKIVEGATVGDSRLRIRILPQMDKLPAETLPLWPCFFADELITGDVGNYVWVVCNNDFSTGYVLGYVSPNTSESSYEVSSVPKDIFDNIDSMMLRLGHRKIAFVNLKVTYWSNFSMHFVSRDEGAHYIAFNNGTIHMVRPEDICCKVGTSLVTIKGNEISLAADTIRLNGAVRLGSNPKGRVLVTQGTSAENGIAADDVWS